MCGAAEIGAAYESCTGIQSINPINNLLTIDIYILSNCTAQYRIIIIVIARQTAQYVECLDAKVNEAEAIGVRGGILFGEGAEGVAEVADVA